MLFFPQATATGWSARGKEHAQSIQIWDLKKIQNVISGVLFSRPTWIPLSRRFRNLTALMNPPFFWGTLLLSSYNINCYSCSCVRTIVRNSAKWVEPFKHGSEWIAFFLSRWLHGCEKQCASRSWSWSCTQRFFESATFTLCSFFPQVLLLGSNGLRTPSLGALWKIGERCLLKSLGCAWEHGFCGFAFLGEAFFFSFRLAAYQA